MPNNTTDTKVDELIINTLTKAQYDDLVANNQVEANQLYLTKDEDYYMQIDVTYGTTTYAQITSALGAKQEPVCNYNSYQYTYAGNDGTYYYFTCAINSEIKYVRVNSASTWSNGTASLQTTISDLGTIRANASLGASAVQPSDLATVATTGDYTDLSNKPTIPTVNNKTITIQKNSTTVDSFTLNQSTDKTINISVPTTAADVGAQAAGNYISYTNNTATVAGTSKTVSKTNPETLFVPNGLIMGGTAAAAGLVTRGVCGVSSPTETGAATKDNLYINYDSTNTYSSTRQVVIQAGSVGTHYGNNLYQYAAARGDAVKNYADATYTPLTRKINNKALSADITLTASDVSAVASNTAITGATKCKITYDSKGLVTAGADLSAGDIPDLSATYLTSHQSIKSIKSDNTTAQSTSSSEAIAGSGTINLHKVSKTGSYNDLLNKPTIPATNVIPATTTANKVLVSTTTSGTAKWSDFSSAGFLKTNSSGVISVDTTTYGTYSKPSGGIPASDLAESYYLASNPSGYTSNAGTVTSVRVQAGTGLASSTSTAQSTTLDTTISIASGYKLPTTTEWSNKQDKLTAQIAYTSKGTATKVPQITTNTLGQVTGITEVDITHPTELPSQTGQSGKYLTTNGTTASWGTVSIPTVNNSTITIQKNGTNVDSFTTNAASGKNINITLAKGDVGLGNVDNTADLDKPISTATQTALDEKQNTISDLGYIRNQVAKVDDKISSVDITDSGDSLPSAANYSVGDTFLNKTDKKLYTVLTPAYQLNSDVTVESPVSVDFTTGIASGFPAPSGIGSAGSGVIRLNAGPGWSGQVQYNIHFKLTSLPSGSNYYCLFYLYGTYRFDFLISSTGFYVRYAYSYQGPTSYGDYVELFNFSDWQINKEYFITINKYSDNSVNTSLRETNYSGNILSQGSTTYNYNTGTEIGYGRRNGYYGSGTSFTIGQIYLADSTGDFLIPDGALTWDSGTTLEDNTQYNDTTNEKTIYYNNDIIYEGGSVAVDSSTITLNSSNQIQTVGYKDVRTSNTLKTWTGTRAQYDAIATKDVNTLYNITDDTDTTAAMLELLYPVGAVYIGTMDVCPLATLGVGSWQQQTTRFLVDKKEPTTNDPSWYNLYSDGWCEQGGVVTTSAASGGISSATVNFSKAFINADYEFHADQITNPNNDAMYTASLSGRNAAYVTISSKYINNSSFGAAGQVTYRWTCSYYTSITSDLKMWRRIS